MPHRIKTILDHARNRFDRWLECYHPWHSDNHITERNLSFQFAQSFLTEFPDGMVFLETPVKNQAGTRRDNHLDTYLHSNSLDVVLECKNFWNRRHIDDVSADIERISSRFQELLDRHQPSGAAPHNSIYGLVLAECWRRDHAEWWKGGTMPGWPNRKDTFRPGWEFDFLTVHTHSHEKGGTLYWLYGISIKPLAP